MSFDTDYTAIKDREVHFPPNPEGNVNDRLWALTWTLLAIDVGTITEKNVDEVWYRLDMYQRLIGAQFQTWVEEPYTLVFNSDGSAGVEINDEGHGHFEPLLLDRTDVEHAVGLRTNVTTTTRTQFVRKVAKQFHS